MNASDVRSGSRTSCAAMCRSARACGHSTEFGNAHGAGSVAENGAGAGCRGGSLPHAHAAVRTPLGSRPTRPIPSRPFHRRLRPQRS